MRPIQYRGIALVAALLALSSCTTDSNTLGEVAKCGNIHFATPPKVVAENRNQSFNGDRVLELVTDIPQAETASFKELSGLSNFMPGVPNEWRSTYWQEKGVADALKSDYGNEYAKEASQIPARWVVVHADGGGRARIYVRVAC